MLKWLSCIYKLPSSILLCFTLCRNVPFLTDCGSKILSKCREDSDWRLCLCVCAQLHKHLGAEQSFCFVSTSLAFAYIGWLHSRLQSLNKLKNSVWAKYMGGSHAQKSVWAKVHTAHTIPAPMIITTITKFDKRTCYAKTSRHVEDASVPVFLDFGAFRRFWLIH